MNILIIEDDRELCTTVSFRLEQEGFSVTVCHDGEEGLYYMQESPFDLVILDRMLPHMNGIEILKEARSRQIKTPVLMLTALGELNDRLAGLNGGADDYMVKPFAFEELLARIRCLLRRPAVYQDSVKFILWPMFLLSRRQELCPATKKHVPCPAGKESLWRYSFGIPVRSFPDSFCFPVYGDWKQMWKRETWITTFTFSGAGSKL